MSKKIIITVGPIPARVDSVKFITNRFKGGLGIKTACWLSQYFDVQIVKWFGADIDQNRIRGSSLPPVIDIKDVYDYYDVIKNTEADAYILSGAVANLAPTNPWEGKFPSHLYKEGDKFNIEFTIAPRAIDMVKKWHPKSTLIGYKLFDGTEEELMAAAWETLTHSRSNVVFANHPKTAKKFKIALMPDGTSMRMSFDEHMEFIKRVLELEWYHTEIQQRPLVTDAARNSEHHEIERIRSVISRIAVHKNEYAFGTVAIRNDHGFMTTTRGKREDGHCTVYSVDHNSRTVVANAKATLNAPVLDLLFASNHQIRYVIHGHRQLPNVKTYPYAFSGTLEETKLVQNLLVENSYDNSKFMFNVENHGYYACFNDGSGLDRWLDDQYPC